MPALWEAISEAWKAGIKVECPEVIEQESFLSTIGAQGMFPLDSDGRRNIGYLMSWRDGADIMITIDDDNLPTQGWLKEHEVVAAPKHRILGGQRPRRLLEPVRAARHVDAELLGRAAIPTAIAGRTRSSRPASRTVTSPSTRACGSVTLMWTQSPGWRCVPR